MPPNSGPPVARRLKLKRAACVIKMALSEKATNEYLYLVLVALRLRPQLSQHYTGRIRSFSIWCSVEHHKRLIEGLLCAPVWFTISNKLCPASYADVYLRMSDTVPCMSLLEVSCEAPLYDQCIAVWDFFAEVFHLLRKLAFQASLPWEMVACRIWRAHLAPTSRANILAWRDVCPPADAPERAAHGRPRDVLPTHIVYE
jgi:hypothetical protein